MSIDTISEDPAWDDADLDRLAGRACLAVLANQGLDPDRFDIAVLGCDDVRIAALNADFRAKPTPTNVLSWPAQPLAPPSPGLAPPKPAHDPIPPTELGDIAIAFGVCQSEAAAQGKEFSDHVTHLLVHGTLHLLGFDHECDEDATLMEGLETEILAELGIKDPY